MNYEIIGGQDINRPGMILRYQALNPSVVCRPALRRAARWSEHRQAESGTIGYYDRPRPRIRAFSRDDEAGWIQVQYLLRDLDRIYRESAPEVWADQKRIVNLTPPRFVIRDTVFTTATVNNTVAFPEHRDKGNLSLGYSVMTVLRKGHYTGGLFCLPEYRLAVDLGDRDVILFPALALHGNTPIVGPGERLSVVAYYRAGFME
jgi:hypothetical protein